MIGDHYFSSKNVWQFIQQNMTFHDAHKRCNIFRHLEKTQNRCQNMACEIKITRRHLTWVLYKKCGLKLEYNVFIYNEIIKQSWMYDIQAWN